MKTITLTITLTEEELKELGELLNTEISDYLDTSLVIVHEEGKQLAIRQANLYKRIYNKLIRQANLYKRIYNKLIKYI